MSFAQEMKDFVSAFKAGSDIWDKQNRTQLMRDKMNKKTPAEIEAEGARAAGDAAERSFDAGRASTNTPSQAIPGVGGDAKTSRRASDVGDANEVEEKFMNTVRTGGDTGVAITNPYGLAAVAATTKAESQWAPTNIGKTWPDPDPKGRPGTSGGLMSWREDRLRNMQNFVQKAGGDNAVNQAKFFLQENPALIKGLNNAKSVDEAIGLMNREWRFKDHNNPNSSDVLRRRSYAEKYLERYGKGLQTALPTGGNGGSNVVAYLAEGGVVDDPEEIDIDVPEGEYASVRALPVGPQAAKPAPEQTPSGGKLPDGTLHVTDSGREILDPSKANEAVAAGMDYLTRWLTGGSAIAQASPDRQAKMQAFASNADSPSAEEIAQIDKTIDPKGELAPHLRSMARLNGMYDFYLKQGNPEKASKMAWSMAQYARKMAMSGGAQMQALIEKGNIAGAAKVFEKTYEEMPNGNNIQVKPVKNGIEYKVFDVDGNPTDGGRMAIDEIMRLATGMQDGTAWFQGMGFMAGQYKEQQRGKGNRLVQAGTGRPAAAPRLTATERAAQAEQNAEAAARGQRGEAIAGKADAIQGQTPDLTPGQTNVQINTPPELAAVGGVPQGAIPTQGKEFGEPTPDQTGVLPYNAGTGVRKVLPEEYQTPGAEERAAGQMSTAGERRTKEGQLVTGARTDEALIRADKEYNARANRKGVRTSDSASNRQDTAEQVAEGFKGATQKDLPGDRATVVNGIAAKMIKGNEGMTGADAGRVIGDIMLKGPAMRDDGTVGPRGGGQGVYLDSRSIKQLTDLYGGKLPSVADVDPKLTPRNYRMPKESGDKAALPGTKMSRAKSAGSSAGAAIADAIMRDNGGPGGNGPAKQESEPPARRNRYSETWRKRALDN